MFEFITGPISGFFTAIMDILLNGGLINYIILFIGIYGVIISIQKWLYFRQIGKVDATEIFDIVNVSMERGGAVEALKQISVFKNPVSQIISETLKIGYKNKSEVEESMEQIFIVELAKMTKNMNTLKTIVELSPFLGLIGTAVGIWLTFKALGVHPDDAVMAEGMYVALTTTIMGLSVAIILLPCYNYFQTVIEQEMDKIELATKMTNWGYAVAKLRVESSNAPCVLEALQDAEGIVNTRQISDPYANVQISFKPNMLTKSISNVILEKCNVHSEIIESKLKQ